VPHKGAGKKELTLRMNEGGYLAGHLLDACHFKRVSPLPHKIEMMMHASCQCKPRTSVN
jgi:hypothetical protein